MLFKEKRTEVNVLQYEEQRREVERRIKFKKALAEETNVVIAVFNKESEAIRINNSILVNVALNCLFRQLEDLSEEEAIAVLEEKVLAETKK